MWYHYFPCIHWQHLSVKSTVFSNTQSGDVFLHLQCQLQVTLHLPTLTIKTNKSCYKSVLGTNLTWLHKEALYLQPIKWHLTIRKRWSKVWYLSPSLSRPQALVWICHLKIETTSNSSPASLPALRSIKKAMSWEKNRQFYLNTYIDMPLHTFRHTITMTTDIPLHTQATITHWHITTYVDSTILQLHINTDSWITHTYSITHSNSIVMHLQLSINTDTVFIKLHTGISSHTHTQMQMSSHITQTQFSSYARRHNFHLMQTDTIFIQT